MGDSVQCGADADVSRIVPVEDAAVRHLIATERYPIWMLIETWLDLRIRIFLPLR